MPLASLLSVDCKCVCVCVALCARALFAHRNMLSACIRITYSRKAKLEIRNRNHYSTSLIISFGARVQCIAVQYSEWVKRAHGARVYMQRAGYECGVRLMFIIVIKQHKWYYEILCRTTRVWGGGGGARTELSTFHIVFYSLWLRNVPFVSQATASLHQESNIWIISSFNYLLIRQQTASKKGLHKAAVLWEGDGCTRQRSGNYVL